MKEIYERTEGGNFTKSTGFGHENRDNAIMQALDLTMDLMREQIKKGRRVEMRATLGYVGKLAFIVSSASDEILGGYAVDAE